MLELAQPVRRDALVRREAAERAEASPEQRTPRRVSSADPNRIPDGVSK